MIRAIGVIAVLAGLPVPAYADSGVHDAAFDRIPFGEWVRAKDRGPFLWEVSPTLPVLSDHQRFVIQLRVRVDLFTVASRWKQRPLELFIEISDKQGRRYQGHYSEEFGKLIGVNPGAVAQFSPRVFLTPGEYEGTVAIYSPLSGDHAVKHRRFKVERIPGDPFPHAWESLPAVEFCRAHDEPDWFFEPEVTGRMNLAVPIHGSRTVAVIANISQSESASGSPRSRDRNWSFLVPELKFLLQFDLRPSTFDLCVLDVPERKVLVRSSDVHELEWKPLRVAYAGTRPHTVAVESLSRRAESAAFLIDEIDRAQRAGKVVLVLSSPYRFVSTQEVSTGPPKEHWAEGTVYYLSYWPSWVPLYWAGRDTTLVHRDRRSGGRLGPEFDRIGPLLKKRGARTFEAKGPADFRSQIAKFLREIQDYSGKIEPGSPSPITRPWTLLFGGRSAKKLAR